MSIEHRIRTPDGEPRTVRLTPRSAIKKWCAECTGWTRGEVENCTSPICPLFPFRLGHAHSGKVGRQREAQKRYTEAGFRPEDQS